MKTYRKSAASEFVKKVELIKGPNKTFLIVSFDKGVHGESFAVWDIKGQKEIFQFNSLWPIGIKQNNNELTIKYFDSSKDRSNALPIKKQLTFKI